MCFFVQTNHTRKELLFLMFKEINLRNHSSLHKLFYSLLLLISAKQQYIFYIKKSTTDSSTLEGNFPKLSYLANSADRFRSLI